MLHLIIMHKHNAVENATEKGWNDLYWNHCVCFIPSARIRKHTACWKYIISNFKPYFIYNKYHSLTSSYHTNSVLWYEIKWLMCLPCHHKTARCLMQRCTTLVYHHIPQTLPPTLSWQDLASKSVHIFHVLFLHWFFPKSCSVTLKMLIDFLFSFVRF